MEDYRCHRWWLWEIGERVLDDLELVLKGFLPQRLPVAQPDLVERYAPIVVPSHETH